jgi:hypothetical protein
MNFEIRDGDEPIPDEEDIYDVNDIEERDQFNALLGHNFITQDARLRRRRLMWMAVAGVILLASLSAALFTACQAMFNH